MKLITKEFEELFKNYPLYSRKEAEDQKLIIFVF